MVSRYRLLHSSLLATLTLLIFAGAAYALGEPIDQTGRPAEIGSAGPGEVLDPVADGYVNRASGVFAARFGLDAGPYAGTPEQAALAYLRVTASDYGLSRTGADLILDQVQEAPGGIHVRFRQAIAGVAILGAEMVVSLDAEGHQVRAVHSTYDPVIAHVSIPTFPVIDEARARAIAIAAVGVAPDARWAADLKSELWIIRDQDQVGAAGHLAWRVPIPVDRPRGDWDVFVDATTGAIVRLTDRTLYVDGQGYVFNPDPLTTARVNYGGNYSDNNDADTAELNAQRFLLPLRDLTQQGGLYYLRGLWAYADDWDSPSGAPPTSNDPNGFQYTRSNDGFEWANAYYNIDTSQRYIQTLGFNTIQHAPFHYDAHGAGGADNSYYQPSVNKIAYGDGGVDDAEDADVILHEYGHAIQNSIVPGWGGNQERAMGEGFGDYWACSSSGALSSFHADSVFNWDGHNPFWPGRMINGTENYQNVNGDIYHDGDIWASCWWLIWHECGRTVTDTDMLKMHFYMNTSASMAQAAAFAMQADRDVYGALHSGSLFYWFVQRRFLTANQFDVPVLTHTPLGDQTTAGPYPLTVTVASTSGIVANSVKVKFGTGTVFDQVSTLSPTGNPNEWGGSIPGQGGNVHIRYYIIADNTAGWRGAAPRGAEYKYYQFHVGPLAGVEEIGGQRKLALLPATPNPFGPSTTIRFDLPAAGNVHVVIHDLAGRAVRTLADGPLVAGRYAYVWEGNSDAGKAMPSGVYFIRLETEGKALSRKILLTR